MTRPADVDAGCADRRSAIRACRLALERAAVERLVLGEDQQLRCKVGGVSMWPILQPGDFVQIERAPAGGLAIGDILVCRHGSRLLVHRLVGLEPLSAQDTGYRCRGDTRTRADEPVGGDDVVGRVVARERRGHTCRLDRGWYPWLGALSAHAGWPLGFVVNNCRRLCALAGLC